MEGFDDAPKPVRVLASFFDEYAEAHEDQPLDLTKLQIMRKNIDQTFSNIQKRKTTFFCAFTYVSFVIFRVIFT